MAIYRPPEAQGCIVLPSVMVLYVRSTCDALQRQMCKTLHMSAFARCPRQIESPRKGISRQLTLSRIAIHYFGRAYDHSAAIRCHCDRLRTGRYTAFHGPG